MKLRKKVLIAALAITMSSAANLSNNFEASNLTNNIAFASEENQAKDASDVEETKEINSDSKEKVEEKSQENDEKTIKSNILVFIKDKLIDLQKDESFDKLKYKDDYKTVIGELFIEPIEGENEIADSFVDEKLNRLIFVKEDASNLTIAEKLEEDKNLLESDKELSLKIDQILKAMDLIVVPEGSLVEGEDELVLKVSDNLDFYDSSIKPYIEEKNLMEKKLTFVLTSNTYSNIEENPNIKYAKEENVLKVKKELEDTKSTLKDGYSTLDDLKKANESLNSTLADLSKDILKEKLNTLENKLKENEDKLSDKEKEEYKAYIESVENDLENPDYNVLNEHIKDLDEKLKALDESSDESTDTDKEDTDNKDSLATYEKQVSEANDLKKEETYYRASSDKRTKFDKSLSDLETYIKEVKEGSKEFKQEDAKNLSSSLSDAKDGLDGNTYDDLLAKAKKKLEDNKEKLGDKYKNLAETYNKLIDKENQEEKTTVDDVNKLLNDIDKKLEEGRLVATSDDNKKNNSNNKTQASLKVSPKKVAVPRANSGNVKKSRSIVRTGIDSVKAFAIIAVVAVVLLIVTKRNKKDQ